MALEEHERIVKERMQEMALAVRVGRFADKDDWKRFMK